MSYERDEAMRLQDATENMIRMRDNGFNSRDRNPSKLLKPKSSPPAFTGSLPSGESDPSVTLGSAGGEAVPRPNGEIP
ncbi:hypothetical protein SAMN05444171_8070 [Bradyrhizobium lablabi]|uniref:Uncharacterized protein n=1 Tax=Bradyrhizobium lablabi TaxID=722472 RepID=A0A1H5JMH1_9BRAD|nr:hypothetical protein SAMN05444171_7867 [Bradyrhizobium lablabi]SEE79084.1 hypothetical protein SAMN05444171_8070 [Bradyrhizobium lablabi]